MIPLRPNGSFATAVAVLIFWAVLAGMAFWLFVSFVDLDSFLIFGGG